MADDAAAGVAAMNVKDEKVVLGEDGQPLSKNALKKLEKAKKVAEEKAAKEAAKAAKAAEEGPSKKKKVGGIRPGAAKPLLDCGDGSNMAAPGIRACASCLPTPRNPRTRFGGRESRWPAPPNGAANIFCGRGKGEGEGVFGNLIDCARRLASALRGS
jgi:hypothetical protein